MKKKRNIIIIVATIGIIIILIIANIAKKDNISKEEMNKIYSEVKENNEDVKDEKPIRTNRINTYVTVEETIHKKSKCRIGNVSPKQRIHIKK